MAIKVRVKDYLDLFRFSLGILSCIALLVAGFIVYVLRGEDLDFIEFLFSNGVINIQGIIMGMISVLLLASAIEAINDVYDVETDMKNERFDRPIVRGAFTPEYVRNLCVLFFSLSIALSVLLVIFFQANAVIIFFNMLCVFIGVGYNYIKRTGFAGNMWVSIGYVAPIFLGFFLLKPQEDLILLNCILMLIATFFLATGREIVKDIQDYEGDKASNMNSLAVRYGPMKASFVAMLFFTSAIISATLAGLFVYKNLIFWSFLVALIVILGITSYTILTESPVSGGKKARKYTRWSLWWALAAFFFGVFFINYPN
ncbi:MAG: UbiA family prenyltransferase [Candidatus Heimdallarchaeota archaeon]|nr:MAG: UbiA family prenyltransferase [Candidatus Heimdallarchaeota archaeon]